MPEIPTFAIYLIAAPVCILGGIGIYRILKGAYRMIFDQ